MHSAEQLRDGILAREARSIARAASLIENDSLTGRELLRLLAPLAGRARTIGITGPPGSGKSTLVNAIVGTLRKAGDTVAVVAVDPSSSVSQGAILGDRVRMIEHHNDPGVFIRSLATRGHTGGLAKAAFDVVSVLDAAGFNFVLIETVGVGQNEVEICGKADVTILVLSPGFGDDVQMIKAGIMETADLFVINKADLPGAESIEQEVRQMQSLAQSSAQVEPVVRVSAQTGMGVEELVSLAKASSKKDRRHTDSSAVEEMATIDHLGVAVRDIEGAAAFYVEQLGLHLAGCETVAGERVRVAMVPVGDTRIELLEATDDDSTIARFIEKRGPGLHHVALRVDSLEAAIERIKAAGGRILNEPRRGAGGHLYVFVHPASTGGVLIELIQR